MLDTANMKSSNFDFYSTEKMMFVCLVDGV